MHTRVFSSAAQERRSKERRYARPRVSRSSAPTRLSTARNTARLPLCALPCPRLAGRRASAGRSSVVPPDPDPPRARRRRRPAAGPRVSRRRHLGGVRSTVRRVAPPYAPSPPLLLRLSLDPPRRRFSPRRTPGAERPEQLGASASRVAATAAASPPRVARGDGGRAPSPPPPSSGRRRGLTCRRPGEVRPRVPTPTDRRCDHAAPPSRAARGASAASREGRRGPSATEAPTSEELAHRRVDLVARRRPRRRR